MKERTTDEHGSDEVKNFLRYCESRAKAGVPDAVFSSVSIRGSNSSSSLADQSTDNQKSEIRYPSTLFATLCDFCAFALKLFPLITDH
jgi:hypothetical protein